MVKINFLKLRCVVRDSLCGSPAEHSAVCSLGLEQACALLIAGSGVHVVCVCLQLGEMRCCLCAWKLGGSVFGDRQVGV